MRVHFAKLALAAALCGLVAIIPAVSSGAGASAAPLCVPDAIDAPAQLAGTPLLVTPAPGSRDAMPETQLSFLGAPAGQLAALVVRGSVSGAHAGRLERYSQGDGASFVLSRPFVAGETVTVSGQWLGSGAARPFQYAFTVGEPDPIERLPEPGVATGPPGTVLHFDSAPALDPPSLTVTVNSAAAQHGGDIFMSTYPGPGATGPTIFDPRGQLVWFKPLPFGVFATNVRVQRYRGRSVLTWWQGAISRHGFGYGEGEIYSTAYRHVATVHAGDGIAEDLHELQLEPGGIALITAWKPLACDLQAVGGPADGAIYDASFQEIDIATGLVRYEWDSLDHVPLSDSYMPASAGSAAWPYDWFHVNSIAIEPDGSLLISARATWAIYDLDAATGQIVWTLGGRRSSFTMGSGTQTAWQHDARPLGAGELTVFDNGGPPSDLHYSRGLVLRVDPVHHTVSLVHSVAIATPIFAQTQGDLELLPDGDWWIGWGNVNETSEVTPSGRRLFEAHIPAGSQSYRTLRYPWSARPATRPDAILERAAHGARRVKVSWNGATAVARWRLEAGPSAGALRAVQTVRRHGFETAIALPGRPAALRVVALDARGRTLGATAVLRG